MLSKRESSYRKKLFAERRYDKQDQHDIDSFVEETGNTYRALYLVHATGLVCGVFSGIALKHLSSRFRDIGVMVKTAEGSFRNLSAVLDDVGDVWPSLPIRVQEHLSEAMGNSI